MRGQRSCSASLAEKGLGSWSVRTFSSIIEYQFLLTSLQCRTLEQDAEMMRLQLLGDPNLIQQLQQVRPPSSVFPSRI